MSLRNGFFLKKLRHKFNINAYQSRSRIFLSLSPKFQESSRSHWFSEICEGGILVYSVLAKLYIGRARTVQGFIIKTFYISCAYLFNNRMRTIHWLTKYTPSTDDRFLGNQYAKTEFHSLLIYSKLLHLPLKALNYS